VFLTYPAGKSVNLNESGNVSPLGTVSSGVWQGSTVGVAYGGTGVTASSGANSVVLRDSNQNITVNRINQGIQTITASGGTTVLTAASQFNQALVGTGGQTFRLPDATTLTDTTTFQFNNNATGTLTIQNNAGTTVGSIASGGAAGIALLSNATVGGTWDVHAYIPENVTWGTNALTLGSTVISGGTWQGGTIQTAYGGTGLTSYTSGGAVYANSSSTLTSGTLPVTAGGTGNTSGQAASTAFSATFNSGGAGGASGSTFNGSSALTVSYNTIGAPSITGANATGTWGINISGNAATATTAANYLPLAGGTMTGVIGSARNDTQRILESYNTSAGSPTQFFIEHSFGNVNIGNLRGNLNVSSGALQQGGSQVLTAGNYTSYAPTLTGGGASGTWGISITGSAGSAGSSSSVSATTATGIQTNYVAAINTTTPGQTTYGIAFSGSSSTDNAQGITWGWSGTAAQAGIYVQSSGSYGTKMYFGTTDSFATGSKTSMSIDHLGVIQVPRSYLQSDSSLRAPIFYDSNNTGYYLDPASTSNLNQVNLQGYLRRNVSNSGYLEGYYGTATSGATSNCIYTIGGAYQPGTTNLGNMYGCGYQVGNEGASPGLGMTGWGLYVASGGTSRVFLDSDNGIVISSGSTRSPIFYDSNDTSRYVDPSGTSNIGALTTSGLTLLGGQLYVSPTNNNTLNSGYAGGTDMWLNYRGQADGFSQFRNLQIGNGKGSDLFGVNGSGGYVYATNDFRAPIFYDSSNTGFYVDPAPGANGISANFQGRIQVGTFNNSQTNSGEAWLGRASDRNSGTFTVQLGGGSSSSRSFEVVDYAWTVVLGSINSDGNSFASSSYRAPIFYDRDNTAYYVNPNSDSRLSSVYANDYFRAQGSTGLYLQDYAYYFDRNPDVYGNWRCGVNPQNSYVGISYAYSSSRVTTMFDSTGNGGLYNYSYWIYYWLVGNACLGVRTSTTSSSYAMYVEGGIYSTGNIVAYSDVRKKREIVTVDNALATVNKLRGVFYKRIETNDEKVDPNKRQIGVIAQEVNEVLPEAVTYAKDVDEYGVQYGNMAGLFIEAIKELTAKIDALEQRIAA
jgi:hypothetical protein